VNGPKREHPRIPVSLQVSYLSRGDLQRDLVTDLSSGGLFIRTSRPLDIGTEIDLEVRVGDAEAPLHVRGRVVWLRNASGKGPGMGIQFTGIMGGILLEMVEAAKKSE
jgi:type IV pilus assembly protein PilZ